MQFGMPHIILGQRPQLSLLTHHHICANKHNTLRKIAKSVNDLNVYLENFLYILAFMAVNYRCPFALVLWRWKAFINNKKAK